MCSLAIKLQSASLRVSLPSSWPCLARVLPKPVPLGVSIVQGSGWPWARPVALKGIGRGISVIHSLELTMAWSPAQSQVEGVWKLPLIIPCPVGFFLSPGWADTGAWGMGCVLSRLTALALSSLGNGAGSAVGCLPGLALGLEFQLSHLLARTWRISFLFLCWVCFLFIYF